MGVLTTHPRAIIGCEEFENFYYIPAYAFLDHPDRATTTLHHWVKNLKEKKKMEQNLEKRNLDLVRLNQQLQEAFKEKEKVNY